MYHERYRHRIELESVVILTLSWRRLACTTICQPIPDEISQCKEKFLPFDMSETMRLIAKVIRKKPTLKGKRSMIGQYEMTSYECGCGGWRLRDSVELDGLASAPLGEDYGSRLWSQRLLCDRWKPWIFLDFIRTDKRAPVISSWTFACKESIMACILRPGKLYRLRD